MLKLSTTWLNMYLNIVFVLFSLGLLFLTGQKRLYVRTIFAGFWENFGLDLGPFDRNVVCNYFAVY